MGISSVVEAGRRLVATSFLDMGRIERRQSASDNMGGVTETWVSIGTVPCRFTSVIDTMPNRYVDATYGPEMSNVLTDLEHDIREGDHIVNVSNGDVWLVIGDKTPASALAVSRRLNVRRI